MDYDRYSADDQIGKIYLNLNPLLFKESGYQMFGFYPIYDTINGCRGEIYCIIKLEPFNDLNKFRQTSTNIRFYHSPIVPFGYYCTQILGFVEELIVNEDPEYQWIDKIRTPRASNEARQLLFYKLSAEVQRKLGNKAIELGGNAVLGYQLNYDLENSSITVRGIATAVILKKVIKQIDVLNNPVPRQQTTSLTIQSSANEASAQNNVTTTHSLGNSESVEETDLLLAHPISDQQQQINNNSNVINNNSSANQKSSPINTTSVSAFRDIRQSSPDADLNSPTPHQQQQPQTQQQQQLTSSVGSNIYGDINLDDLNTTNTPEYKFVTGLSVPDGLHLLEYPFITMKQFPIGLIKHLGGVVSSRSVKHLAMLTQEDSESETRDAWWSELRKEIRKHCRMLDCNSVLGYTETTTIHEDVSILSASGTAALLNTKGYSDYLNQQQPNELQTELSVNSPNNLINNNGKFFDFEKAAELSPKISLNNQQQALNLTRTNEQRTKPNCSLCHIPYGDKKAIFGSSLPKCAVCKKGKVPDVIFCTIEPPINLPNIGTGCLIQARVFRNKKDTRAKEISDSLPFLEYEIHKQLLSKLKMKKYECDI